MLILIGLVVGALAGALMGWGGGGILGGIIWVSSACCWEVSSLVCSA